MTSGRIGVERPRRSSSRPLSRTSIGARRQRGFGGSFEQHGEVGTETLVEPLVQRHFLPPAFELLRSVADGWVRSAAPLRTTAMAPCRIPERCTRSCPSSSDAGVNPGSPAERVHQVVCGRRPSGRRDAQRLRRRRARPDAPGAAFSASSNRRSASAARPALTRVPAPGGPWPRQSAAAEPTTSPARRPRQHGERNPHSTMLTGMVAPVQADRGRARRQGAVARWVED